MDTLNIISDLLLLVSELFVKLWENSFYDFLIALVIGLIVAGIVWWLSSLLAFNFNRQFSFHAKHHIYCGITAVITLFFVMLFVALQYTKDVAQDRVIAWGQSVKTDTEWRNETFIKSYEAVYALRDSSGDQLEDFSEYPHPESSSNRLIPTTEEQSKKVSAQTYTKAAIEHFDSNHNFLSLILWAGSNNAEQLIHEDMNRVFASGQTTYDLIGAVKLAEDRIRQRLEEQLPRVVLLSRIFLAVFFLLVQLITLGLLVRAALADIKVKKH